VAGSDKGIGFSAYQGRLLGCVLCSKTISDGNKKLWSGELESPPSSVVAQLERFVRDSNFTGGTRHFTANKSYFPYQPLELQGANWNMSRTFRVAAGPSTGTPASPLGSLPALSRGVTYLLCWWRPRLTLVA
jgi:hypothetical protein